MNWRNFILLMATLFLLGCAITGAMVKMKCGLNSNMGVGKCYVYGHLTRQKP